MGRGNMENSHQHLPEEMADLQDQGRSSTKTEECTTVHSHQLGAGRGQDGDKEGYMMALSCQSWELNAISLNSNTEEQWFTTGDDFVPRGHLARSGDTLAVTNG